MFVCKSGMHVSWRVWDRSEDNFSKSTLSFHHVDCGDLTQDVRLVWQVILSFFFNPHVPFPSTLKILGVYVCVSVCLCVLERSTTEAGRDYQSS